MGIEDLKKNANGSTDASATNNDNKEALEKAEKERNDAVERAAKAEFDLAFAQSSAQYPLAKDHENDIRDKVKSGYSVDDAVVAVLQKAGKLKTAADIAKEDNKGAGMGGSAPNGNVADTGEKKDPTVEEAAQAFRDAEARGEIFFS